MNDEFVNFVRQMAIENAVQFKGSANPKAMIGKVMPNYPEMKSDMKTYMQKINEIVTEVNNLGLEKQQELLAELNPNFHEEKEKKNEKKTGLPDVPEELKGQKLITRFPPAPSGNLHLGHLFGLTYNYEYAKESGGELILRLEDTNPENISLDNYEAVIRDAQWVCDNNIKQIHYQSDRVEIYYEYLEKLINTNNAYICNCNPDEFKEKIDNCEACPCRELGVEEQQKRYQKLMNNEYQEGEVVMRFKSDINHKNPAMRDFSIARVKHGNHARVGEKYKVWPMYNLCVSVDDSLMGISYIVRGKDLEIGGERQNLIKDALGLKKAPYFHYGRMKFTDVELSKTKLSQKIEDGEFEGWDDVRVPTILAFKKRGYKAEAFRKCLIAMGMSKRDSKITKADYMKNLDFFNKEIIDPTSRRVACIFDKKECVITNPQDIDFEQIEMAAHPTDESFKPRVFNVHNEVFVESKDASRLQAGDIVRLMHFANFEVESVDEVIKLKYISKDYDKDMKLKGNIQFVFNNQTENIVLINEENEKVDGICETLDELQVDDSLQFERFGFVRFDRVGRNCGKKKFYFTQK